MFIHLRWHSHYSFLGAISKIWDIVKKAASLEMNAIALTDYNAMHWCVEFYKLAKKSNINPLIGVDLNVFQTNDPNLAQYITILPKNFEAYENLLVALSDASTIWLGVFPYIGLEDLKKFSKDWIVILGAENSPLGQEILAQNAGEENLLARYQEVFLAENIFLQYTLQTEKKFWFLNQKILEFWEKLWMKVVPINSYHYVQKADKDAYNVALSIRDNISFMNRDMIEDIFHILSEAEALEIMKKNGLEEKKSLELVENTNFVASQIDIQIPMWHIMFPNYVAPEKIQNLYENNKNILIEDE